MNKNKIQITPISSVLSNQDLLKLVVPFYEIENPASCDILAEGANDSYKVVAGSEKYLLRVYSKHWRTKADIQFEVEALCHLHKKGVKVSYPVKRKDGDFITPIEAPEGTRYVIITTFADGKSLYAGGDSKNWALHGKQVAQIHNHSNDFVSSADRFKLDLEHLISEPLTKIKPFFKHRLDDWKFLVDYAEELSDIISKADKNQLDYGFCHGDFHGDNTHILDDQLTSFDFDCCGYGLRSYDLAVFKWRSRQNRKETENWSIFLKAYKEHRDFSENDLLLIEPFVSVRNIWFMGFYTNRQIVKYPNGESYFDYLMKFIREAKEKLYETHG